MPIYIHKVYPMFHQSANPFVRASKNMLWLDIAFGHCEPWYFQDETLNPLWTWVFHGHWLLLTAGSHPKNTSRSSQGMTVRNVGLAFSFPSFFFGAWWEKSTVFFLQTFGTVRQDAVCANWSRFGQMNMLSHISISISMTGFFIYQVLYYTCQRPSHFPDLIHSVGLLQNLNFVDRLRSTRRGEAKKHIPSQPFFFGCSSGNEDQSFILNTYWSDWQKTVHESWCFTCSTDLFWSLSSSTFAMSTTRG